MVARNKTGAERNSEPRKMDYVVGAETKVLVKVIEQLPETAPSPSDLPRIGYIVWPRAEALGFDL
jgi:hypothetical protein